MNKKAVLFDLDGTLIDSMDLHYLCWCEVLAKHGKLIEKTDFLRLEGANIYELLSGLINCQDFSILKELIKIKDELFADRFGFNLYPGVQELKFHLIQRFLNKIIPH